MSWYSQSLTYSKKINSNLEYSILFISKSINNVKIEIQTKSIIDKIINDKLKFETV